jgi:hypothetical protein
VGAQIKTIAGLAGTKDVDQRTSEFISNMVERTGNGKVTSHLTEAQVSWIEDIHRKHFGDAP